MSKKPSVLYHHPLVDSLAQNILEKCPSDSITHGNIQWRQFLDGWPNLFIEDVKKNCVGRNVIFLGSLHSPNIIFQQIAVLFELPRYLSKSVTFILPYFPTATMERVEREGAIATASTMARILSSVPLSSGGPCQIVIFDIHALQERFYFGDNVIPRLESAIPLLLPEIRKDDFCDVSIVFPDEGAAKRFQIYFENLFPIVTCLKVRDGVKRNVKVKDGEVVGRHCVVVDDLVMTGGTLIECAKLLKENGATAVSAFVTHAVFPKESWKKFTAAERLFHKFFITDSIPHACDIGKHEPFVVLSLAEILAKILLSYDLQQ